MSASASMNSIRRPLDGHWLADKRLPSGCSIKFSDKLVGCVPGSVFTCNFSDQPFGCANGSALQKKFSVRLERGKRSPRFTIPKTDSHKLDPGCGDSARPLPPLNLWLPGAWRSVSTGHVSVKFPFAGLDSCDFSLHLCGPLLCGEPGI